MPPGLPEPPPLKCWSLSDLRALRLRGSAPLILRLIYTEDASTKLADVKQEGETRWEPKTRVTCWGASWSNVSMAEVLTLGGVKGPANGGARSQPGKCCSGATAALQTPEKGRVLRDA